MNEQTNCVLTAKDVEGMRERLKKIQALAKGGRRVGEHCRMLGQTLSKGQRKVLRAQAKAQKPIEIELDADTLEMIRKYY